MTKEEEQLIAILMREKQVLEQKLDLISKQLRTLIVKRQNMLMHIISLTEDEDESYEFQDNTEQSDAYINVHYVASVTPCEEHDDRCFVYMTDEDYFYVNENIEHFIARYQATLYGSVLTKFYDSSNKQN